MLLTGSYGLFGAYQGLSPASLFLVGVRWFLGVLGWSLFVPGGYRRLRMAPPLGPPDGDEAYNNNNNNN